jgi:hypothetical protein
MSKKIFLAQILGVMVAVVYVGAVLLFGMRKETL